MKRFAVALSMLFVAPVALAYQVTGPVLDVTDTKIVVEKDKEKWEIARDKDTKVTGDLKKGSRVTVQYKMTATAIEVRDTKGKDKEKDKEKDKDPKAKDTKAKDSKEKDKK